jgi:hypothetical protein
VGRLLVAKRAVHRHRAGGAVRRLSVSWLLVAKHSPPPARGRWGRRVIVGRLLVAKRAVHRHRAGGAVKASRRLYTANG